MFKNVISQGTAPAPPASLKQAAFERASVKMIVWQGNVKLGPREKLQKEEIPAGDGLIREKFQSEKVSAVTVALVQNKQLAML